MNRILPFAYAVLGALVAAPAVVSLIQSWAGLSLAGAFQSGLDAYRAAAGAAFGWIDGGLGALLGLLGIHADLPGWVPDLHVLSLAATAIWLGSRLFDRRAPDDAQAAAHEPEDRLEQEQLAKEKAREDRMQVRLHPLAEGLLVPLAVIAAGLVGLGVVWLPGILVAGIGHRASWRDEFKAHFVWATAALVIAFYAGAWAMGVTQ